MIIKELFEGPVGDYCIARNTIKCLFNLDFDIKNVCFKSLSVSEKKLMCRRGEEVKENKNVINRTYHRRLKWGRARGPNILSSCRFGAALFFFDTPVVLFYNPDIEILLARFARGCF